VSDNPSCEKCLNTPGWITYYRTAEGKRTDWEKGKANHVGMIASNDINLWRIELNNKQGRLAL